MSLGGEGDGDERTRRSIQAWAERVRAGADDDERSGLAEILLRESSHPSSRVRQVVAEGADLLPSEAFDAHLALLGPDQDHFVRAAIERAAKNRAARRTARVREVERETVAAEAFDAIEKKYGKGARRQAERAARRSVEYFVVKLHHEASKIVTPLEFSLNRLRSGVAQADLDRGALAHDVAVAWERNRHLRAVLDRAREASATVVPRFGSEELLPIVKEAGDQLAVRLGPRAGRLALVVDVPAALRLDVHRSGLLQALQNFLQNAVEAYPDDAPRLDVRVAARTLRAESQVEITIADRGVGMSESQRADLFVPFGSRKAGGTGVGLIIARTMVQEVHGGSLSFESARGVGTTVKVVVPTHQAGRGHA